MAKIFHVRAPDSLKLQSMSEREISELVEAEATKALAAFPARARPVGVNSMRLSQDLGGWAEWTRACCGSRAMIEDYTDPIRGEWEAPSALEGAPSPNEHIESSFKIQSSAKPAMHRGRRTPGKA